MASTPLRVDLRRGQVYRWKLPGDPKEGRPWLVVSSDTINSAERHFIVMVPFFSDPPPWAFKKMSVDVSTLRDNLGLAGYIRCDHVTPVDRAHLADLLAVGRLAGLDMAQVDQTLRTALDCG